MEPGTRRGRRPPTDGETGSPPGDPQAVARIICLRLLERRARSRAELADALSTRGVPDDAADAVLDRFAAVGLFDDAALAAGLTATAQRDRGLARRAVGVTLRRRGLDGDTIEAALAEIDPVQERARAVQLVARRHRSLAGLPLEVRTRRLVGLLGRKGYPAGLAWEVVRAELAVGHEDGRAAAELDPPDAFDD